MPKISELTTATPTTDDFLVFVDNADNTTKKATIASLPTSVYTDEQAQDAVGTILVDSARIDFTYNDAIPSITADIIDDSVTFAKMQNISTNRILGRSTAGTGDIEELNTTAIPALIGLGTSDTPQFTAVNIGNTDTTLGRSGAGIINVEGEVLNGYASTATAAGTTTLTVASARVQHFTGTTTQTVVLPTTSVVVGQQYEIVNRSTGLVTVQSSGLNTIVTLGLNQKATLTALQAVPTSNTHWSYEETNLQGNSQGKRLLTVTQSATPSINTNNGDIMQITGLAQAITSMSTNLTGNPVAGDMMMIQITDNGTARAITWGASYASTANATLPTTTVISTMLRILFQRNDANTIWDCISVT